MATGKECEGAGVARGVLLQTQGLIAKGRSLQSRCLSVHLIKPRMEEGMPGGKGLGWDPCPAALPLPEQGLKPALGAGAGSFQPSSSSRSGAVLPLRTSCGTLSCS